MTFNDKSASDTLPTDSFTKEDFRSQNTACANDRDMAFIALLYETRERIGPSCPACDFYQFHRMI